jgi:AcrR family transcriptional regulator
MLEFLIPRRVTAMLPCVVQYKRLVAMVSKLAWLREPRCSSRECVPGSEFPAQCRQREQEVKEDSMAEDEKSTRSTKTRAVRETSRRGGGGTRVRDAEVLRTAIDIFYRKGYSASSVQDVADALGMLKGSLYYYIESKEDLLRRIFEANHAEASEVVERIRGLDSTSIGRLAAFFVEYAVWYLVNVERATLYQREWRYVEGDLKKVVTGQRAYYDEFLIGLIEEATRDGFISPPSSARDGAYFILSAINGLPDWYHRDGSDSPSAVAEIYAVMALNALGMSGDASEFVAALPEVAPSASSR